jgi:hypothetical protein
MVYPALLPLMRTLRLPVVDVTDAPADLSGLVRFAERRNLVSARVPSHFERSLPTLQLMSRSSWQVQCVPFCASSNFVIYNCFIMKYYLSKGMSDVNKGMFPFSWQKFSKYSLCKWPTWLSLMAFTVDTRLTELVPTSVGQRKVITKEYRSLSGWHVVHWVLPQTVPPFRCSTNNDLQNVLTLCGLQSVQTIRQTK